MTDPEMFVCENCGTVFSLEEADWIEDLVDGEDEMICPRCGKGSWQPAEKCEYCNEYVSINEINHILDYVWCDGCLEEIKQAIKDQEKQIEEFHKRMKWPVLETPTTSKTKITTKEIIS